MVAPAAAPASIVLRIVALLFVAQSREVVRRSLGCCDVSLFRAGFARSGRAIERPAQPIAFAALIIGISSLAFGPWLVRIAGTGLVAAGFWRLALALPLFCS